ncbi:uncharacterized protein LOC133349855 [Lethenteron reissneri]|uniref:uncharacterized protein LOC133349855 n=1 Tax=Lethenteron reissneri TaxID=7753 RepID=UPI002AB76D71|nr:uncharacterized protein LOC133349855 [Lethenteron reissneri]
MFYLWLRCSLSVFHLCRKTPRSAWQFRGRHFHRAVAYLIVARHPQEPTDRERVDFTLCGRRSATHGARGERGRLPTKLLIPRRRRTPPEERERGDRRVVSFAANMFCKGVKILLIFVTVSWAESLASRAQFDFCDLNMRFEIFLSRITHINTLQTNCANYSNSLAKLKGKPFLCLAGGQLNDTAMEACLAEIVDGLNHFRDFFFGNNCSESCDTLKSIRDIFLNSNIFHPTKAQSPEAARPPPAAPPRSLEGGLLDCGVFHLRLYVANVHRHAVSRGHAGACRGPGGVAVVAESATRTPGGVTQTPRRRLLVPVLVPVRVGRGGDLRARRHSGLGIVSSALQF